MKRFTSSICLFDLDSFRPCLYHVDDLFCSSFVLCKIDDPAQDLCIRVLKTVAFLAIALFSIPSHLVAISHRTAQLHS